MKAEPPGGRLIARDTRSRRNPRWGGRLLALVMTLAVSACAVAPPSPTTTAGDARLLPPPASPLETPASVKSPELTAAATVAPTTATAPVSGESAVGAPTDPLAPNARLDLAAEEARRDLWVRIRRGFAMPDLDTGLVRSSERWYASRPDYVQRMTDRSSRFLFHIVQEVEKRGMPTELALLPFIESAFNPQAMSSAKASGMWQFVPATGLDYDLRQNVFRDDRRDVLASTRAALDYLQKLHGMFGDWQLALAAYNWGEGSVGRAIARNRKAGLPTDYLSLKMPAETQGYVPKLQAVKNLIARPEQFGLRLPPLGNHPYFVVVPIQRDIDADLVVKLAGLSVQEFQALNPSLNKPVILAAGTPQVLLPYDNANDFLHGLAQHRGPLASWTAWVVPRTMKPADAARQVGMGEAELREVNRIPPRMLVKAGSTLLVPRQERRHEDVPERLADTASIQLAADTPALRRTSVKAGKGDSVASIAARYRVAPANVASWNKVAASTKFKAGQAVVLYLPGKAAVKPPGRKTAAAPATRTARSSSASRPVASTAR
jgi:membrane-bound lytic murein transglycosylase D